MWKEMVPDAGCWWPGTDLVEVVGGSEGFYYSLESIDCEQIRSPHVWNQSSEVRIDPTSGGSDPVGAYPIPWCRSESQMVRIRSKKRPLLELAHWRTSLAHGRVDSRRRVDWRNTNLYYLLYKGKMVNSLLNILTFF